MKLRRTTVYLEADLHKALKRKAAEVEESELVTRAVRASLLEDAEDLVAFEQRRREPHVSCETVLKDLRRRGRR